MIKKYETLKSLGQPCYAKNCDDREKSNVRAIDLLKNSEAVCLANRLNLTTRRASGNNKGTWIAVGLENEASKLLTLTFTEIVEAVVYSDRSGPYFPDFQSNLYHQEFKRKAVLSKLKGMGFELWMRSALVSRRKLSGPVAKLP